ncbi:Baeyer-Villiger monooxygenase [Acinetobacter oleivorans]|nr:Baeyer-Villiger monooxygenase [Acinetobacter oleivorans]CAI3132090.1 Baeyer-Villiger monooxygenase [Acinetobacter oleivorans]CAI3132660.1 Baeyer-Villiger monooxygenase [Acinetobacter oleivorans]CAI3132665.1 Baeyer-Villiger monooxygenase [Acinetobacter oleivorans]CAI3132732.1 Baeyer-Villiger monooxygenase [Acinetobacter oleivorans]
MSINIKNNTSKSAIFQNTSQDFEDFTGQVIPSTSIKEFDFTHSSVAIIGTNQDTVTHLEKICQQAKFVTVFQITPHFILPHSQMVTNKLITHPLIIKNRRLFNNRVKGLLALRFLDTQVSETWLKRLLTPNMATAKKVFFKSDSYYAALQKSNCKLQTWPIVKVNHTSIHSMDGIEQPVDIIIRTTA